MGKLCDFNILNTDDLEVSIGIYEIEEIFEIKIDNQIETVITFYSRKSIKTLQSAKELIMIKEFKKGFLAKKLS